MLNHASFGMPTCDVVALAERTRAELEADSLALVDVESLLPRTRASAAQAATQLGLEPSAFALTQNATSGGAAVMRSLRPPPGATVAVLSTEYASITRGWQVRCEELGASFVAVTVPMPLASTEQLLDALEAQVRGEVAVAQLSLVASSTAIHFPVEAVTAWFRDRGALVVLDAAHGPGQVPLLPREWGVAAMFGTLHKWFPTPRPVGFVWVGDELRGRIRPAEVSLTWDAEDLVDRFAWPGTYDPAPRLCVPAALATWRQWSAAGDLERCGELAEYASERLVGAGGAATASAGHLAPRLRSVVLPAVPLEKLRLALAAEGIRAFAGLGPGGETMLRIATHVYNDPSDVDALCALLRGLR